MQLLVNIAGVIPTGDSEKSILSNSENKNPNSSKVIQFYIKLCWIQEQQYLLEC